VRLCRISKMTFTYIREGTSHQFVRDSGHFNLVDRCSRITEYLEY
jgi:hypothetical protein